MLNFLIRTSLVILLGVSLAWADVQCDGTDDDADTATALSNFMSASTGTWMMWYKPTGTASSGGSANCYDGERLFADHTVSFGGSLGFFRNSNLGGNDRLCASSYSDSESYVESTYTNNAWTHLAAVHTGGNLLFYKDGALVGSTAAADIFSVAEPVRICLGPDAAVVKGEGVFADVRMYSTGLSANEIAAIAGSHAKYVGSTQPTGAWHFGDCADGASGDAVTFTDRSGAAHPMTGSDGANNTGLTCLASGFVTHPWGVE